VNHELNLVHVIDSVIKLVLQCYGVLFISVAFGCFGRIWAFGIVPFGVIGESLAYRLRVRQVLGNCLCCF
jgi:hypothetical protein